MAKWTYVGPRNIRGVLLRDSRVIFPEAVLNDAEIDAILAVIPEMSPYWRLTSELVGHENEVDFTPLSNAIQTATQNVTVLLNEIN